MKSFGAKLFRGREKSPSTTVPETSASQGEASPRPPAMRDDLNTEPVAAGGPPPPMWANRKPGGESGGGGGPPPPMWGNKKPADSGSSGGPPPPMWGNNNKGAGGPPPPMWGNKKPAAGGSGGGPPPPMWGNRKPAGSIAETSACADAYAESSCSVITEESSIGGMLPTVRHS